MMKQKEEKAIKKVSRNTRIIFQEDLKKKKEIKEDLED